MEPTKTAKKIGSVLDAVVMLTTIGEHGLESHRVAFRDAAVAGIATLLYEGVSLEDVKSAAGAASKSLAALDRVLGGSDG